MSEYCEYMWDPFPGRTNSVLVRDIYAEGTRLDERDEKLAIKTVRAILRGMPNVDMKKCTDEYIMRFLLARKYRTEQAAGLIAAYQAQLEHRRDIFDNLTARDPALQRALRAGIPGVLPARDRKGRCVLIILASQWDPIAVPALAVQRAIFLVLEILIQDPRNQQFGFVVVVDWNGFTLRQGSALGAAALRNLIGALRGRFPARFKAVHFLLAPLYVQATLALIKPFLDEKTRRKIYLHGNNLSTLHDHLPTDILPAELGGTGPAFNPGLWAEPVIQSAMKEAEIEATQKQKENTSRSPKESPVGTDDTMRNGQRTEETQVSKKSTNSSPTRSHPSLSKESNRKSLNLLDNSKDDGISNMEMNLIDYKESSRTHDENANDQSVREKKNVESQNGNDDFVKVENENKLKKSDNSEKSDDKSDKEDDFAFLEYRAEINSSETDANSNEFETIFNKPDSDESKDNSLDNNPENVLLKVKTKGNLSEETNLVA